MKKLVFSLVIIMVFALISTAQVLSPYTLGATSDKGLKESAALVKEKLKANGFQILGEYAPAEDKARWLIVITSESLLYAAGKTGGLTGFAAALRVALTRESGRVLISYTTPEYWLNAYYRDDFDAVKTLLDPLSGKLEKVMQESGTYAGTAFGSEKGLDVDDLRSYKYMMGMPKFHETKELGDFASYKEAIDKVESSLLKGVPDVTKVYSIEIPGKELKLYGFALGGEKGESHFLPIVDVSKPKHTAFLPYEFLVMGNEVHMLHGRFRIALSFPDLKMGTFTKIMSSPGDIKDLLETVVE
ncbi:MAG: hypothetical protein KAT31_11750 [Bacteroidales bacterium]|nr:hypothetical protein [Bacteroidales bacterium]